MADPRTLPPHAAIDTTGDVATHFRCDKCGKDSPIRAGVCIHCGDAYGPEDAAARAELLFDPATGKGVQ